MERTIPEPTWSSPQYADSDCSALKARLTPFLITGAFIRLVQYHFSDPDNIETDALKGYVWTDSPNGCISTVVTGTEVGPDSTVRSVDEVVDGSKILITISYNRDGQNVQQRPAILIKREQVQTGKISFQDKTLDSLSASSSFFPGAEYQINITGSHSLIAVGKTGAEAERLAEEVFYRMLHYKPLIIDELQLGMMQVAGMSDVRELGDEAEKAFYVVVGIKWAYVYRWRVIPEAPVVKRLHLSLTEQ